MTYEELMASLSEDQRGIISGELTKKNNEASNLRTRAKAAQDLIAKITTKLGIENIDDTVLESLRLADGKDGSDKVTALEGAVRALTKQVGDYSQENKTLKRSQLEKGRDDAILAELGKHGIRPESLPMVRKVLASEATYDETTGEWNFSGKPIADHLGEFVKTNQYLVANPQKPGAGSQGTPAGGQTNAGADRVFKKSEVERMTAEEKAANADTILKSANHWHKPEFQ